MMKALARNKKIIIHNIKTPGPSNFFDPETYNFLDKDHVFDLVERGIVKLEVADIPYIILIDTTCGTFYDTTKACFISEAEAKKLTDSGKAELRLKPQKLAYEDNEKKEDLKEKVLMGAAAAGGTTAVAAGAASLPFLAGFTSAGVAAGSVAAGIQSSIGCVAAGSGFATMQSLAATTLIGTCFPAVVAGAAVAGTATAGAMLFKHRREKKSKQEEARLVENAQKKPPQTKDEMGESDDLIYEEDTVSEIHDTQLLPPHYDDISNHVQDHTGKTTPPPEYNP